MCECPCGGGDDGGGGAGHGGGGDYNGDLGRRDNGSDERGLW